MNYTFTESNILGKKDAEVDFDTIFTNNIIVVYIPYCSIVKIMQDCAKSDIVVEINAENVVPYEAI
jgi:hypothetical protein